MLPRGLLLAVPTALALTCGGPAGAAPAAGAPLGSACAGVKGCVHGTTIDVDGDGRTDDVGIVRRITASDPGIGSADGYATVYLRTATGKRIQATARFEGIPARYLKPLTGTAQFDGVRGAELVVPATFGAHAGFFTVLTYRAGTLVQLPAPIGTFGNRWGVDGAATDEAGITCNRDGSVTVDDVEEADTSGDFTDRVVRYRWNGHGWAVLATRTTTTRGEPGEGGFHCSGLPGFP